MFHTICSKSPVINVNAGKHQAQYSVDGSLMNPLEAFYASLAGCAAVYTKKACKELGISPDGVEINCRPFAGPGGALSLAKFRTEVKFPDGFTPGQKDAVMASIAHCAVKAIVVDGASIDFSVVEA